MHNTTDEGLAVTQRVIGAAHASLSPDSAIKPWDALTWTFLKTPLAGGYMVYTSWNPIRFAPFYGLTGRPSHHFETLVTNRGMADFIGDSQTYLTEQDAREGHAVMVARLRTMVEAAS